jgi:hypothetical protein
LAADQIVLDPITLVQIVKPGALDGRDVHESIGSAALRLDKTKSLGGIEPLHSSSIQELDLKSMWRAGRYAAARVSLNVSPGKQRAPQGSEAVTPPGTRKLAEGEDSAPKSTPQGRLGERILEQPCRVPSSLFAAIQRVTGLAECASFLETINYDLPNARAPHRTPGARGRERRRDLALRCRGAKSQIQVARQSIKPLSNELAAF